MANICYSGGAKGADITFGNAASKAGHKVIHWSFQNHHCLGEKNQIVRLNAHQLSKADEQLKLANYYLQKTFPTRSEYVNNLLRRNYYQVNGSDRIYAACRFDRSDDFNVKPLGGTSWALVMGIDMGIKEVYVFDLDLDQWLFYENNPFLSSWQPIDFDDIPKPSGNYAGIGASNLTKNGKIAIESLYQ